MTLAAGTLLEPSGHRLSASLAIRIFVAAFTSCAFVFYVAQYSLLCGDLVRLERQFTLTDHGRFATSDLGPSIALEALFAAVVSSGASFVGALIPLLSGALSPAFRWTAIVVSIGSLGILGWVLAGVVHGGFWPWPVVPMAGSLCFRS